MPACGVSPWVTRLSPHVKTDDRDRTLFKRIARTPVRMKKVAKQSQSSHWCYTMATKNLKSTDSVPLIGNKPIYDRAGVKRGGADFASRVPAHPLRRRLRSIWLVSDLSADELVVHPATHPLSPRPRESFLPLNAGSVRSLDRRDVMRSTIDSGITGSLRCRH